MPRDVEVRNRFEGNWTSGYQVEEVVPQGGGEWFRLRRRSDGRVLPVLFPADQVRAAGTIGARLGPGGRTR
ncbi:MAG TPA: hypothetical protein VE990_18985 [Acidimicrobiales bacterium]|nr:hypothetical protein [Acidimicrobiales bacterium]